MNNINSKEKLIYVNHLIGNIYKILPLTEDNSNKIPKLYTERLIEDIISANVLFDGLLILLIAKLNILITKELSHKQIKSIIFESINLCKKIIKEIELEK